MPLEMQLNGIHFQSSSKELFGTSNFSRSQIKQLQSQQIGSELSGGMTKLLLLIPRFLLSERITTQLLWPGVMGNSFAATAINLGLALPKGAKMTTPFNLRPVARMVHAPKCSQESVTVKTKNGLSISRCDECGAVLMERD